MNCALIHMTRFFGKPNADYDFRKHDVNECKKHKKHLEERHKTLERSIDRHVMDKFDRSVGRLLSLQSFQYSLSRDRVEKNELELKKKLSTVVKDKAKIQETIGELDKYKREALLKTWEKVNQ